MLHSIGQEKSSSQGIPFGLDGEKKLSWISLDKPDRNILCVVYF